MDILKKEMAPTTNTAWEEIITQAKKALKNNLSANPAEPLPDKTEKQ